MSEIVKFEEKQNYLQKLIDSKNLPGHIKSVESAFLIDNMGKELGFPTIQAMHYIIPIQGKLTLSTKAIGAILRKNGVKFKTLEDAVWVYADGSAKSIHSGDIKPVDRRTTIKFERYGEEEIVDYMWSDATSQGLINKDNWKRMPKEMMYARCLTKGANRVAQDLLMGLYSTDEMADVIPNVNVKRDDDGQIQEVIDVEFEAQ